MHSKPNAEFENRQQGVALSPLADKVVIAVLTLVQVFATVLIVLYLILSKDTIIGIVVEVSHPVVAPVLTFILTLLISGIVFTSSVFICAKIYEAIGGDLDEY